MTLSLFQTGGSRRKLSHVCAPSRLYLCSLVPQTAPRLIHSVKIAISFGGSLGPGGIWISPSWRTTSTNTLCSGLPGTIAGPRLPPLRRLSRSRNEMPPLFSCRLWQPTQRLTRMGATRLSKKRSAGVGRPAGNAGAASAARQHNQPRNQSRNQPGGFRDTERRVGSGFRGTVPRSEVLSAP
jgi:hypothetical protein